MKKILFLILALLMIFSLAACGNDNNLNEKAKLAMDMLYADEFRDSLTMYNYIKSTKAYGIHHVTIEKEDDDYIFRVVFKYIKEYIEPTETEEFGTTIYDENNVSIVDFRVRDDYLINVVEPWYLFKEDSNVEMPAGKTKISELYDLGVFTSDVYNGMSIDEITEDEISVNINLAGLVL